MLLLEIAAFLVVAYVVVTFGSIIVAALLSWTWSNSDKKTIDIQTPTIPKYSYSNSAYGGVIKNW